MCRRGRDSARAERVLGKWAAPGDVGLLARPKRPSDGPSRSIRISQSRDDLAAYADAESGRAAEAMERLLERAARKPNDTGVLAGLVTTCRYAGVLDGSKAAHQRVMAIVPTQVTSVCWTHMMLGDYASDPPRQGLAAVLRAAVQVDAARAGYRRHAADGTRRAFARRTARGRRLSLDV